MNYNNRSTIYDLLDVIYFNRKDSSPRTALVDAIPVKRVTVLDICAGTCSNSILIAENKPNTMVTALDLSADMLKIAKKKIHQRGIKNIELVIADASNSGLPAHSFDIIIVSLVLHEINENLQSTILQEVKRLLSPNGKVIIIEWAQPEKILQCLKFTLIKLTEPRGFKSFLRKDLTTCFENAGFGILEKRECDYTAMYCLYSD